MSRPLTRALALLVSLSTLLLVGVGAAGTASAKPATADALTGAVTGVADNGTTFVGSFDVQRFDVRQVNGDKALFAVGTVTGTLTNTDDTAQPVQRQVAFPVNVAGSTGTCEILTLVLGPLDLDLLGLQIHLDQVVLEITAQQGPGNLLGNLLCAIAGLLDGDGGLAGILNGIASLLNRILGALG